ncbi:hypothetical protein D6817_05640 [Candidatus Pacearchaeota archaeon]|nr:MAG: hypothetical protein D6817_05640 [Candidatus Pacearchaeota archaeon]
MQRKHVFAVLGVLAAIGIALAFANLNHKANAAPANVQFDVTSFLTKGEVLQGVQEEVFFARRNLCRRNLYLEGDDNQCTFTCPTKSGRCTPGEKACDEDLGTPPTHACEYECTSRGTWGPGTECSYNMCNGGQCL